MLSEEVFHLIRWESLNEARFRLHVMLTAVIQVQLMKSTRIGAAGLIHASAQNRCWHQWTALAELHDVGGFMGKDDPDVSGIIRQIVATHQQGLTPFMKSSEQTFRAIIGDQGLNTGFLNQPQIGADLIPA